MIVLDASVIVDLLLRLPPHAEVIAARVAKELPALAAPHLLDAEVGHALRRRTLTADIELDRAIEALDDLIHLPVRRYPHVDLLPRAFELRDNATMYDALYLALAEALDAPLLTRDAALAKVPGVGARVEVLR